jgi:hypothetical protein
MRFTTIASVLALFIPIGAAAQQPGSAKPASSTDLKPITVVGCLQTGAQAGQFVLVTTADPLARGVAVATSGAMPNVTYQLSGGSNLAAHVGHRVEIAGTTSGKAQKSVTSASSVRETEVPNRPDPKVETKEKAAIEVRDLTVQNLKMVSTDCGKP